MNSFSSFWLQSIDPYFG